jgi:hypothetical protein
LADAENIPRKHRQKRRKRRDEQRRKHHHEQSSAHRFILPAKSPTFDDTAKGMAEPKQPEITISEGLDGADFRELMPETCGSGRGGMSNLASYRSLDVLFRSRWSYPKNSLKLIVEKIQCSPTGAEDCRPSYQRIRRAVPLAHEPPRPKSKITLTNI